MKTAYQVAEAIQSRFSFDEEGNVIGCKNRFMSDILGSDWASNKHYDNYTAIGTFYNAVICKAEKIYGPLPF